MEGPKFRAFFPSRPHFRSFSLSLWGSSRGILVVFDAPGPLNVYVWSSRALVSPPKGVSGGGNEKNQKF